MRKYLTALLALLCLLTGCAAPAPAPTDPPPAANPYDGADFAWKNGRLTCLAGQAVTGIDVSAHQGAIDWATVAADGIEFAMIRVGYRGIVDGEIEEDPAARANIEGALAAGLRVGVYFFSQAVHDQEAIAEAAFVVNFIRDYEITMPVVFDWEHVENPAARTAGIGDKALLTACADAFLTTVQRAGYEPMIYFNRYQSEDLLDLRALKQYGFWLASYDADMTFPYRLTMWQYTDRATVAGITEKVDLNLYFPPAADG